MDSIARQRQRISEAARAFVSGSMSVSSLGSLVSSLSFLSGVLMSHGETLPEDLDEGISTLEQIYGVALDREWKEIPPEERRLVLEAVELVRSSVSTEG